MKFIPQIILVLFLLSACGGSSDNEQPPIDPSEPPVQEDTTVYDKPSNYDVVALNIAELKSEISTASAGDVIALADGTYRDVELDITTDAVTIVAETSGSVFIEGTSTVELSGDDIIFEGFTFQNGEPADDKGAIIINGHRNRVTNCKIDHFDNGGNEYKWVSFNNDATYGEVDHCTFTGKQTEGALLVVWRNDDSRQDHKIYCNIFSEHQYVEDNDVGNDNNAWEAIRIGTSAQSQSSSYTTVEYNYFYNNDGEIETISNKSGHNIYRYNTFEANTGLLTLRHGNNCTVDSNYFLIDEGNSSGGGIRVIDKGHSITNNYIEGVKSSSNSRGAIALSSSLNDGVLSGYWEVSDVDVSNNTIINSKQSLHYGSSAKEFPPESATISNNLIRNNINGDGEYDFIRVTESGSSNSNAGELLDITNPSYSNNYFYGSSDLGLPDGTPEGINLSEVALSQNANGQYYATDSSLNVGAPQIEKLSFDSSVGSSF